MTLSPSLSAVYEIWESLKKVSQKLGVKTEEIGGVTREGIVLWGHRTQS